MEPALKTPVNTTEQLSSFIKESTENLQNFNNLNGECKISDDINIDLQKCTESFKKFPIVENIYRTPVNTTEQLSSFIKESTENLQNFNNLNGECKISDDINIDLQKGEFLDGKNVRATEKRFGVNIVRCTMNDANGSFFCRVLTGCKVDKKADPHRREPLPTFRCKTQRGCEKFSVKLGMSSIDVYLHSYEQIEYWLAELGCMAIRGGWLASGQKVHYASLISHLYFTVRSRPLKTAVLRIPGQFACYPVYRQQILAKSASFSISDEDFPTPQRCRIRSSCSPYLNAIRQMKEWQLLETSKEALIEDLDPDELYPHLLQLDYFTLDDLHRIEAEPTKKDMVKMLLKILPRTGPGAFGVFMEALRKYKPHLHRLLKRKHDALLKYAASGLMTPVRDMDRHAEVQREFQLQRQRQRQSQSPHT
ncbi:hypothetical protein CAPTEDRAFT_193607 [Capitella teleta]|uniref:CARD domain-containing protein n=1 Tax=Capitella teleta TaxID=283909 RepID=R7VBE6_CAPTE|nr:hypothetical protein CAPTEDRAFT_193607 [Capitella teleta]|eukprot:ELU15954.1 hypothetical protein CAPTEDRAFT_193607 [Capitella teleta]